MGLPGPLAQGNVEMIDQLLCERPQNFIKHKHYADKKGLKNDFSIAWQQAMEIKRKWSTCSLYNQTLLPAGSSPKNTRRNEILQMECFICRIVKLKYVHHTIDTYSGFK